MFDPTPSISQNFPASTARPSTLLPFTGVTPETTAAVRKVLEENDRGCDIFEEVRYAHNHFPHSVLTRYALGAPSSMIEATWACDKVRHVSLNPTAKDRDVDLGRVPEEITVANWDSADYLGFDGSYSRYLTFFHKEIDRLGPIQTVKQYVFSAEANITSHNGNVPAKMLVRCLAGFLHPMIHIGFGIEFCDRVVLAEGLAQAAVHRTMLIGPLFVQERYERLAKPQPGPSSTTNGLRSSNEQWTSDLAAHSKHTTTALEIYSLLSDHDKAIPLPYDTERGVNETLEKSLTGGRAEGLISLADKWSLNDAELRDGPGGYEEKVKELSVLVTLIACASSRWGKKARVEFFTMHCLTSSIFLPVICSILTIPERRVFLDLYLLAIFDVALLSGRPKIDAGLLMSYPITAAPRTETKAITDNTKFATAQDKNGDKLPYVLADPSEMNTRNPWLSIIESCLYQQDSHTPKCIRALLYHSHLMSHLPAGSLPGAHSSPNILGLDKADGTIFLRAAGVIMEVKGWVREGEEEGVWARNPLGYDETWEDEVVGWTMNELAEHKDSAYAKKVK